MSAGIIGLTQAFEYAGARSLAVSLWEVADTNSTTLMEDMMTTGGSIMQAVDALLEHGCDPHIYVAATHGIFAADAVTRICSRSEVTELVVTDSVPLPAEKQHPKIRVLSVASMFGEAIHRANNDLSITSLFD